MRKYILTGLFWVAQTFSGPYALEDVGNFLGSLPAKRAIEAKIVNSYIKEEYGIGLAYTVFYRIPCPEHLEDGSIRECQE